MLPRYFTVKTFAMSILFQPFYFTFFMVQFDMVVLQIIVGIVFYIMIKFIKKINSIILNIDRPIRLFVKHQYIHRTTCKFIIMHNHFCHTMYKLNFLFSRLLLLACLLLSMPSNLINLQQILVENVELEWKLFQAITSMSVLLVSCMIQYWLAYLSKEAHRTTVHLSRLQWRINGQPFGLRHKIKLMSYFERLSSNRKIGITMGPTITLTMNIFAQV